MRIEEALPTMGSIMSMNTPSTFPVPVSSMMVGSNRKYPT